MKLKECLNPCIKIVGIKDLSKKDQRIFQRKKEMI